MANVKVARKVTQHKLPKFLRTGKATSAQLESVGIRYRTPFTIVLNNNTVWHKSSDIWVRSTTSRLSMVNGVAK